MDKNIKAVMRRGSLASALSSLESLHKKVPNFARVLSHHQSRDHIEGDNKDNSDWLEVDNVTHKGFITNGSWKSVQGAILSIFEQKPLTVLERTMLCENMREIGQSEIGPFVHDFYKNHLVKRAMAILLNHIDSSMTGSLQENVINIWTSFYTEILPLVQTVFLDISMQLECCNVRDVTLLAFRNHVLFQVDSDKLTQKEIYKCDYPPAIVQMLLVLQHVVDPDGYTEDTHRLQQMVAKVVTPYLGYCGLYVNHIDPVHKSVNTVIIRKKHKHVLKPVPQKNSSKTTALKVPAIERLRNEGSSPRAGRDRCHTLTSSTTSIDDIPKYINKGRRHSVQFDLKFK